MHLTLHPLPVHSPVKGIPQITQRGLKPACIRELCEAEEVSVECAVWHSKKVCRALSSCNGQSSLSLEAISQMEITH